MTHELSRKETGLHGMTGILESVIREGLFEMMFRPRMKKVKEQAM